MGELLFSVEIPGRVGIKKNSKRLIANQKRLLILPSKKYAEWERFAMVAMKQAAVALQCIECPVVAEFTFYFLNRQHQSDIDNMLAGPMDILQKAGVIKNDSQIQKVVAEKLYGFEPKIIIELFSHEGNTNVEPAFISTRQ